MKQKKVHWVIWDRMCKPKEVGGLGIRELEIFNTTLVQKWW
jgi:hypothetical protein